MKWGKRRPLTEPRPDYGRGAFRGYVAFRYGDRSIYATGRHPVLKTIMTPAKRQHFVEVAMAGMKQWTSSPFQFEGAYRAGLRTGFIALGHGWDLADFVASDIIAEVFNLMGAVRPTIEQGQPEYLDFLSRCAQCSKPFDDEDLKGTRRPRFCSPECARAATNREDVRQRPRNERFRRAARNLVYRSLIPMRECVECGKQYRPNLSGKTEQRYCSIECQTPDKKRPKHRKVCLCCGLAYVSVLANSLFCTQTCRSKWAMLESGRWAPKKVSPVVFDHAITIPLNTFLDRRLTPQKLDWFFMEAGRTITGEATVPRVTDGLFVSAPKCQERSDGH